MSESYLQSTARDLIDLNLLRDGERYHRPDSEWSHVTVASMMSVTEDIRRKRSTSNEGLHFAARTAVGSYVQHALGLPQRDYEQRSNYIVCDEAERKLVASLLEETVRPDRKAPIILAEAGRPIGFIKSIGETTIYGLKDKPELNILKGAFSAAPSWTEDLMHEQNAPFIADVHALPPVELVRYSEFVIPAKVRNSVNFEGAKPQEIDCARVSHDWIQSRVLQLGRAAATGVAVKI